MRALSLLILSSLLACGSAPEPAAEAPAPAEVAAKAEPAEAAPEPQPEGLITVTTLKNGSIEDEHTMRATAQTLTWGTPGDLSTLGGALTVHTDTWDSPIEVRDGRVIQLFLAAADHPTATFAPEAVEGLTTLEPGARGEGTVRGSLTVRGTSIPVEAPIAVTRGDDGYTVTLREPVAVTASSLGLSEALSELAGACGVELADTAKVAATFTIAGG